MRVCVHACVCVCVCSCTVHVVRCWGCLHCFPPRGPVSTTSFGGGGGGGSYKTTAFIHRALNSELEVDKSEGAGMRSLR